MSIVTDKRIYEFFVELPFFLSFFSGDVTFALHHAKLMIQSEHRILQRRLLVHNKQLNTVFIITSIAAG